MCLFLSSNSFNSFPSTSEENHTTTSTSTASTTNHNIMENTSATYLYANLQLGSSSRMIFAVPDMKSFHMEYISCILPGLDNNIIHLRESITSTSCQLQVHTENICARVFNEHNIDEYNSIMMKNTDFKKNKTSNNNNNKNIMDTVIDEKADKFLIDCIKSGLADGKNINMHGTIRFRLEQLLDSAPDLLTEFKRLRQRNISSEINKDDNTITMKVNNLVYNICIY